MRKLEIWRLTGIINFLRDNIFLSIYFSDTYWNRLNDMNLPQHNKGGNGKELGYRRRKIGHEMKMFKAGYIVIHNIIVYLCICFKFSIKKFF